MNSLIDNAFDAVSDNQWANYCKHVEHIEQGMWKADNLQNDVGPFIVQFADSSNSSSTDDRTLAKNICSCGNQFNKQTYNVTTDSGQDVRFYSEKINVKEKEIDTSLLELSIQESSQSG
jgi:hypothetical protein